MHIFKASHIFGSFILLIFVASCCDAWGRRKSSSSSSSSNSKAKESVAKVKETVKNVVKFTADARKGAQSMVDAYKDMREVNSRKDLPPDKTGVDKFFHARANFEAAKHGPGGKFAAKVISDTREFVNMAQGMFSKEARKDSAADQEANKHGRNGGDPNDYKPEWLPAKYWEHLKQEKQEEKQAVHP